ncbi:unnamed protein product [Amaranthus hypochondriacus]
MTYTIVQKEEARSERGVFSAMSCFIKRPLVEPYWATICQSTKLRKGCFCAPKVMEVRKTVKIGSLLFKESATEGQKPSILQLLQLYAILVYVI